MSQNFLKEFGQAVRGLRKAQGWSQEQLAAHSNLDRSYVGEIERAQAVASLVTLYKLSQALGTDAVSLLAHCAQAHRK